jgi:opacity protein-like surface antigen
MAEKWVGLTLGGLLAAAVQASAADMAPPPEAAESGWSFVVAPYLWGAGITGDVAQFGLPEVEIDASFIDILENFDIGVMAVSEARYGRFGITTDLMYVRLSTEADTPLGVVADSIEATTETLTVMLAGSFRLIEGEGSSLDILAGGRLWSVQTDLELEGGPGDGTEFDDGDTWVDPIIGAKGRAALTDNLYLTGWGMIGGFGVSSDLTWDVMGGIGYAFSDSFSVVGGYRGLGVDYQSGDFVFDVVQHGPLLGAVLRF